MLEKVHGKRNHYLSKSTYSTDSLGFISLKMELHWRSNPIGKVRKNLPFFKELAKNNFTQLN